MPRSHDEGKGEPLLGQIESSSSHRKVMHGIAARRREAERNDMTAKRDLKRRVRLRQARTGESYVTARRRVLAARAAGDPGVRTSDDSIVSEADPAARPAPADAPASAGGAAVENGGLPGGEGEHRAEGAGRESGEPEDRSEGGAERNEWAGSMFPVEELEAGVSVVELHDVTEAASLLGFRCRIAVYPDLLGQCELAHLLAGLRDALVGAASDPETARLFGVAFGVAVDEHGRQRWLMADPTRPGELARAVRELYGGAVMFQVAGRGGPVDVIGRPWNHGRTLVLRQLGDLANEIGRDVLGAPSTPGIAAHVNLALRRVGLQGLSTRSPLEATVAEAMRRALTPSDGLFVIHEGRRHRITRREFVIGRDRRAVDLCIRDGLVSRKHAAVIYRGDAHYLKDLSSTHGVTYKGMQIDNKRIDEGDVFQIGSHELRFTYRRE
jgi:hypothetical protein